MHLGDRPRGKRLWIELSEKLVHRGAELALDECSGDTGRVGRHIGLQPLELTRHVETDEVRAQAQHLPEFDPRRAELGERPPEPLSARHPHDLIVNRRPQHSRRDLRDPMPVIRQPRETVAPKHSGNFVQSLVLTDKRAGQVIHAGPPAT